MDKSLLGYLNSELLRTEKKLRREEKKPHDMYERIKLHDADNYLRFAKFAVEEAKNTDKIGVYCEKQNEIQRNLADAKKLIKEVNQ